MHHLDSLPLFSLDRIIFGLSPEDDLAAHPSGNVGIPKPDPLQNIDVIADLELIVAPFLLSVEPLRGLRVRLLEAAQLIGTVLGEYIGMEALVPVEDVASNFEQVWTARITDHVLGDNNRKETHDFDHVLY